MYIYNTTININESIHLEWLHWMKEKHIPAMLATGKFSKVKMCQVLVKEEMGGVTYSVQYTTNSLETLHKYYKEDASKLRSNFSRIFKDKFVIFSTELKVISEQFNIQIKN